MLTFIRMAPNSRWTFVSKCMDDTLKIQLRWHELHHRNAWNYLEVGKLNGNRYIVTPGIDVDEVVSGKVGETYHSPFTYLSTHASITSS